MSCYRTIRGSATGSILTTVKPDGSSDDAIVAARDPHFHPEHGLEPHRPQHLLLWEADEVNHIEDVSSSLLTKLDALEAHVSQFESTMKAVDEQGLAEFRERMTTRLADIGGPFRMQAAEAFHLMSNL